MKFIIEHKHKRGFYLSENHRWTNSKRPVFYGFYDQTLRVNLPVNGRWVLISLEE